jgi:hypothetical protein
MDTIPHIDEPLDFSTLRYLNETALCDHALRCSARFRANHFTRVGQDFIDEVKADVERMVRELRGKFPTVMNDPLQVDEKISFTTGLLCGRIEAEMNAAIGRLIQNKVQRQPTVGKTLRRTR